jgi:DNA-binding SARP family transcriptional activator
LLLLEKARAGEPPEAWFDSPGYRSVSRHETDGLRGQPNPGSDPAGMSRNEARLVCFGGFRLIIDGEERTMNGVRPRARRLLHLLALEPGRDRHREWLIDTLWPNVDLPTGTRRLQVAVSSIRHEFNRLPLTRPPDVHRRGDSYGLELPPGMEVDVELFERLVRTAGAARRRGDVGASAADRQHALDLYVGDLLPEDGPAEHVVTERDRLRLLAAVNAADLARDYAQLGRATAAVTAVQRSIVLDPFSDLAWSLLVDLHTAAGDLSAAARVRLEHERVRHELAESIG